MADCLKYYPVWNTLLKYFNDDEKINFFIALDIPMKSLFFRYKKIKNYKAISEMIYFIKGFYKNNIEVQKFFSENYKEILSITPINKILFLKKINCLDKYINRIFHILESSEKYNVIEKYLNKIKPEVLENNLTDWEWKYVVSESQKLTLEFILKWENKISLIIIKSYFKNKKIKCLIKETFQEFKNINPCEFCGCELIAEEPTLYGYKNMCLFCFYDMD